MTVNKIESVNVVTGPPSRSTEGLIEINIKDEWKPILIGSDTFHRLIIWWDCNKPQVYSESIAVYGVHIFEQNKDNYKKLYKNKELNFIEAMSYTIEKLT